MNRHGMNGIGDPRRVLAITYCLFVFGAPAYAGEWPTVIAAAQKSVVKIEIANARGEGGHCSGAIIDIDKGLVVTAGHCVLDAADVSYAVDGRDAKVVRVNHVLDLAILKTKVIGEALLLAVSTPAAGTAVAALGYPLDAQSVTVQVGIVANPKGMDPHTSDVNIDVLPGNSGGPLIDNAGHLVGIVSGFHYAGPAHLAVVADFSTLRAFIEDGQ